MLLMITNLKCAVHTLKQNFVYCTILYSKKQRQYSQVIVQTLLWN